MEIRIKDDTDRTELMRAIYDHFMDSRFTLNVEYRGKKNLKLKNIRLRESKKYCGNHPAACEGGLFGGERPHRKSKYLEGADWVDFNDRLNDLLDRFYGGVNANVQSVVCIIRKDRRRRVNYDYHRTGAFQQFTEWDKEGEEDDYSDFMGQPHLAPNSEFPFGTPGLYTRKGSDYACVG